MIIELDHIQLAMPENMEVQARAYYQDLLGIPEVKKPEQLQKRGGCWFVSERIAVHLGVETTGFVAAKKAHPAFRVKDLVAMRARLLKAGYECDDNEILPGIVRFYSSDPFGNRIEFLTR